MPRHYQVWIMGRHAPCLASLVFPRAELSGRICLGFRNAITRDLPADDTADGGLRLAGQNHVAVRFSKVIRSWMQQEAAAR